MEINNVETKKINEYYNNLNLYLSSFESRIVKFIDLGTQVIRLICLSAEFLPLVEKQLTYSLKNNSTSYDATIVIWKETDFKNLAIKISEDFNPVTNLRLRIEWLLNKQKDLDLYIYSHNFSKQNPVLEIKSTTGFINGYDRNTNTYYYGVKNLEPEEFIKEGHIFVQIFNKILKTTNTNLVHGAVIGLNHKGALFCARGQRGKSTLAVLAMLEGFEYVSDDYLVLEKEGKELYSHPIYSIITLSPRMYNELYYKLNGCKFVSNNARKDKYVINISNHHHKFKQKYPISYCIFPEIVSDREPSIRLCTKAEKGRAITHLVHSTIIQMQDKQDIQTIKKIIDMIKDYEFYKFNLSNDIYKNVEFLRSFMESKDKEEKTNDKLCIK